MGFEPRTDWFLSTCSCSLHRQFWSVPVPSDLGHPLAQPPPYSPPLPLCSRTREEPATEHLLSHAHPAAAQDTGGHTERSCGRDRACVALGGLRSRAKASSEDFLQPCWPQLCPDPASHMPPRWPWPRHQPLQHSPWAGPELRPWEEVRGQGGTSDPFPYRSPWAPAWDQKGQENPVTGLSTMPWIRAPPCVPQGPIH